MTSEEHAGGDRTRDAWRRSMRPRIESVRRELGTDSAEQLAERSGAALTDDGIALDFLGRTYAVSWPSLTVRAASGEEAPEETQILLLDYLASADGSPPSGRWVGFQELPDGAFYRHAFQGYTGNRLVRDLGGEEERFRRGAEALAGEVIEFGDAGYAFDVLPHVRLAIVWWRGDEEFPAKAHVLFDAAAATYLPTDGLAIVGSALCRRLIAAESS
jgi:hypothetical protein